jgi:hypothetical protein
LRKTIKADWQFSEVFCVMDRSSEAQGPSNEPTDPSGSGESKGKRKKPTPDLEAIEDPAERRKQRRLAKNRATAAVSRFLPLPSVLWAMPKEHNVHVGNHAVCQ